VIFELYCNKVLSPKHLTVVRVASRLFYPGQSVFLLFRDLSCTLALVIALSPIITALGVHADNGLCRG